MEQRHRIELISSSDSTEQPSDLVLPATLSDSSQAVPLVVSLHPWSCDLDGGKNAELERLVAQKGWIYLWPNFRGRNDTPQALGSELAQTDILDAVDWVVANHRVDERRIFVTGESGGGHMTMLMIGRYPERWTAAMAWVGISDLAAWHETHADGNYGAMIRQCVGGAPGDSAAIDDQLRRRSPLTHLAQARDAALHIAAGRHDGHTGSVPVRQSLNAFNVIAAATGAEPVAAEEIEQISRRDGTLQSPRPCDLVTDESFGRRIYLRRDAGRTRVTVFEGGHEGIATATMAWFEAHA